MRWSIFKRSGKDNCERTKGMLSAHIVERLSLPEQEEVEQHLDFCQGCQEELASLRATVGLLHRVPQLSLSRSFAIAEVMPLPRQRALPALRIATAIVAVALAFLFVSDSANLFEAGHSIVDEEATSLSGSAEDSGSRYFSDGVNGATGQEDPETSSEEVSSAEAGWLSLLEYSLFGVVVVLGGTTLFRWRRERNLPDGIAR